VLSGRYDEEAPTDLLTPTVNATQGESLNFWAHLRAAHLITGPGSGAAAALAPSQALGRRMGVQQGGFGLQGAVLCLNGISQEMSAALDI